MTLKKEIKTLAFELKSVDEEGGVFTFEGYASAFNNVDYGKDVIVKGAFQKSLSESPKVPVLWQHNMQEPVGVSIELKEDDFGLYIKATLPLDDSLVSGRIVPQMKIGSIKEMSIGFFTRNSDVKDGVRYLTEIELFEVSLVTKAMNNRALVTGFKSADLTSLKEIEQTLKDAGFSNTEAKTLISKIKEFSNQRDAEEKQSLRDAETKAKILADLQDLTKFIKQN